MANIAKSPSSLTKPATPAAKTSAPPASSFAPKAMHVPDTIAKTPANTPAPIVKPAPLVPLKAVAQDLPKGPADSKQSGAAEDGTLLGGVHFTAHNSLGKPPKAGRTPRGPMPLVTSATGLLRKFIIDGRMTDDEVLDQIKAGFGLDAEGRKELVKWYRKHLMKARQQ